jgi:endonuclease/exonuclease/phosphatase family metal-dependent hydrolase
LYNREVSRFLQELAYMNLKKLKLFFISLILIITLISCDEGSSTCSNLIQINVGTFNIQYLSSAYELGDVPRTPEDYAKIVKIILDNDYAVVALQEINGTESFDLLYDNGLPAYYKYELGISGGNQKVAILYNSNKISSISNVRELKEDDGFSSANWGNVRYPLHAQLSVFGGMQFSFISVHLKAGIDDTPVLQRKNQIRELTAFLQNKTSNPNSKYDENIFLLGDFNDVFEGINENIDSLQELEDASNIGEFLTKHLTDWTQMDFQDLIDHVFVSTSIGTEYIDNSIKVIKFDEDPEYDGFNISDHRPVVLSIKVPTNCGD